MKTKQCNRCKNHLPCDTKHFHRNGKYLKSYCKSCASQYHKARYLDEVKNNDDEQSRRKKYYQDNKDQYYQRGKRWREENREAANEYQRQRRINKPEWYSNYNKQYYSNPGKKIAKLISRGIWGCLSGKEKRSRSIEYLGCSIEELWIHLESMFQEGMTRENYGEWHLDHIRPLSSFDFSNDTETKLREAWHYTNLQPLWAKDNLSKGKSWRKKQ